LPSLARSPERRRRCFDVGVFSEYRFTSFEPTFACHHNLPGLPHRDRVRMDLDTHHFVTGVSIRF
jgi:hypothetical protein